MELAKKVHYTATGFEAAPQTSRNEVIGLLESLSLELRANSAERSSLVPIERVQARLYPDNSIQGIVCWPDANYRYSLHTCYPAPLELENPYPRNGQEKPVFMGVKVSAGEACVKLLYEGVEFEIHF